jgi:hypothetical protein
VNQNHNNSKHIFRAVARQTGVLAFKALLTGSLFAAFTLSAATVWTGPIVSFTEATSDPTLPQNQDRLTPNVWITRGALQGIFNKKTEASFTHFLSPADTAWADGNLSDYATLSYTDWNSWAKGIHFGPSSTVGVPAVVHLISEDIYLSVTFTSWGGSAGGFSWLHSTPALPAPLPIRLTGAATLGNGTFGFSFTNTPGFTFTVLSTTNTATPLSNWDVAGTVTNSLPGSNLYQFTDSTTSANIKKFYQVRWP